MSTASQETHSPTERLPQSRLVPIDQVPKSRRPYGSAKKGVSNVGSRIVTPAGVFAQVISTTGNSASVGHVPLEEEVEMEVDPVDGGVSVTYVGTAGEAQSLGRDAGSEVQASQEALNDGEERKRAHKKERQWRKWSEDVIPILLKPYLTLMRETQSLRHIEEVRGRRGCTGCTAGRLLEVSCIYFNRKSLILVFVHVS